MAEKTITLNGWNIHLVADDDGSLNIYTSHEGGKKIKVASDTSDEKEFFAMLEKK